MTQFDLETRMPNFGGRYSQFEVCLEYPTTELLPVPDGVSVSELMANGLEVTHARTHTLAIYRDNSPTPNR